jgi:hypothetical protein
MARIIFAVLRDETEYTGRRKKKQQRKTDVKAA